MRRNAISDQSLVKIAMTSGKLKFREYGSDYRPYVGCIEPITAGRPPWQLWWTEDGTVEVYEQANSKPSYVLTGD